MGRNNRIEFNDFDNTEKNKIKEVKVESVFNEDDIDSDVVELEDVVPEDEISEYKPNRPKASLFEDVEYGDDFSDIESVLSGEADSYKKATTGVVAAGSISEFEKVEDDWVDEEFEDTPEKEAVAQTEPEKDETKKIEIDSTDVVQADFDDDEDDMFNPRNRKQKKKIQKRTIIILCAVFGILSLIVTGLLLVVINIANQDTVYTGISLYGKDLGGMTQQEVAAYIDELYIEPITNAQVNIVINDKEYVYPVTDFIECPDAKAKAKEAYDIKREGSFLTRFINILKLKKNGQEISLVYNFIDSSLDKVMNSAETEVFSDPINPDYEYIDGGYVKLIAGKVGSQINKRQFEQDLLNALSDYEKEIARLGSGKNLETITISAVISDVAFKPLSSSTILYDGRYYEEPRDAYPYVKNAELRVAEEKEGKGLDSDPIIALVAKINNREVSFPYSETFRVIKLAPDVYKKDLENSKESKYFKDKLSSYSIENTADNVDDETVNDASLRGENLSIIASKLNGYVLDNGGTFDFNSVIGSLSGGDYVSARENISGSSQVMGGGVSLAATTLYTAVKKYSGLRVTSVKHSEFLPHYGERGFDSYINQSLGHNLVFTNNSGSYIKIVADYSGAVFTVKLVGQWKSGYTEIKLSSELKSEETDGQNILYTYDVKCDGSTTETVVYKESYEGDPNLPTTSPDDPTMDPTATTDPNATDDPSVTDDPNSTEDQNATATPDDTSAPENTATAGPSATTAPVESGMPEPTGVPGL